MITSVFGKSKPINFILCAGIIFLYFVKYLFSVDKEVNVDMLAHEVPVVILLLFSVVMVDFIVKKNDLTQKNDYAFFFFTIFLGLFPGIFSNVKIVCILILLLLAFRRIISLRRLNSVKLRIFDATMYITLAVLLDSWTIIYLLILYIGIMVYVSNDYRNWLVPLVGFIGFIAMYYVYQYLADQSVLTSALFQFDTKISYSLTNIRRILLHAFIIVLFSVNFVIFFLKIKTYSSQKKVSFLLSNLLFFIGIIYVLFAKNSTQNTEILLLFPLTILVANILQNIENKRITNGIALLLMLVSLLFNFYPN